MSTEAESRKQMVVTLLSEDLKTYRSLENWGATLFLTAIALLAKQIFDWDELPIAPIFKHQIGAPITAAPAMVGLVAYIFLRIVNYRSSATMRELYEIASSPAKEVKLKNFGWLGWLIAGMPLGFGLAASWYFSVDNMLRLPWVMWISGISVAAVGWSVIAHLRARGCLRNSRKA